MPPSAIFTEPPLASSLVIRPLSDSDLPELDAMLDRCFGPARNRRTASLLREGAPRIDEASFTAWLGATIVGSVQCHLLDWAHPSGRKRPVVILGPLVSHPEYRGEGIGSTLMGHALAAADRLGLPVLLIGDEPYYGRWGFSAAATGEWLMPGPVDRRRLLLRASDPESFIGAARLWPLQQDLTSRAA